MDAPFLCRLLRNETFQLLLLAEIQVLSLDSDAALYKLIVHTFTENCVSADKKIQTFPTRSSLTSLLFALTIPL
jgi:hypothetical protein